MLANVAKDGGKIYIKPSKRGTFTAAAKKRGKGVQEFARQVLANKDNYSPAMVKKANFAKNFGGHRKDEGGQLDYEQELRSYEPVITGFYEDWKETGAPRVLRRQMRNYDRLIRKNLLIDDGLSRRERRNLIKDAIDRSNSYVIPEVVYANYPLGMSRAQGGYPEDIEFYSKNLSSATPKIFMGTGTEELPGEINNPYAIMAHEFSHATGSSEHGYSNELLWNLNSDYNNHDEYTEERGADLMGLRALMDKEGMENVRRGGKVRRSQIRRMRKKYPELRILRTNQDDKLLQEMLNNVAHNNAADIYSTPTENIAAEGGQLSTHGADFSNGMTLINKGGTHEQNPFEGVQIGVDTQGVPNLVEEGEVIFNDYVFSNRLHPSEKELEKANLPKRYKNHTFALIAEDMGKESSERPNDPISRRGLEDSMRKLSMIQENKKAQKNRRKYSRGGRLMADGGTTLGIGDSMPTFDVFAETDSPGLEMDDAYFSRMYNSKIIGDALSDKYGQIESSEQEEKANPLSYLQFAPVIGSAVGAIKSLFQKPDYENAEILKNTANSLSSPAVNWRRVHNYMTYKPLDRNYYLNQLKGQAGSTRRGIMNSGPNAGNVMAGLLAADYNAQNAVGNTLMKMEQYNDQQRRAVEEFNRGTNLANSQGMMQADSQNAALKQNRDRLKSSLMTQYASMREDADAGLEQTRSANISNFFNSLANIGYGTTNLSMANAAAGGRYTSNMGAGYYYIPWPTSNRYGGMLTKRNRRRR